MVTKIAIALALHFCATSLLHLKIIEGDDVLVACLHKENDVVLDCLLWQLLSQQHVTILLSCCSHIGSSSKNKIMTKHASSTQSCHGAINHYQNYQHGNLLSLRHLTVLRSFVCEG
jgi:hypothetical protein